MQDSSGQGIGRHGDLYLTTHNNHKREITKPPERFEPEIPASERPQTYTLDRAAAEIGLFLSPCRKSGILPNATTTFFNFSQIS
jgi:hypothetical protein